MVLKFDCPHCGGAMEVQENEINCAIFRHAAYRDGRHVNPHAPKDVCDKLVADKEVLGCCKPFELIKKDDEYEPVICDYK